MDFILSEGIRRAAWETECWMSRVALTLSLYCVVVSFGVSLNYSMKQLKKQGIQVSTLIRSLVSPEGLPKKV